MSHLGRRIINLCFAFVLAVMSINLSGVMSLTAAAANNGTLKVHDITSPAGTVNNEPKVCVFNFEGFGFDANESGIVTVDGQGQTPGTNLLNVPLTINGTGKGASSPYVNDTNSPYMLAPGHYKATFTGAASSVKSKVFKVDCTDAPVTPEAPTVSAQPSGCVVRGANNGSAIITVTNTEDATGAAVTYTVAVTGKAPQTITDLADGQSANVTFSNLGSGTYTVTVTGSDQTTATTTFSIGICPPQVVVPTPPTYVDDCGGKDTYTIPSTPGVIYQVQNIFGVYQTTPAGTYNVTVAQYISGVKIRALPANNAYILDGQTTWTFKFSAKPCEVPATPPTKIDECGTANDKYVIPESEHVKYYVNLSPIATPAGTYSTTKDVLIVAVPDPGYVIDTQFIWVFTYTNQACPTPVTPEAPSQTDKCGTDKDGYTIPNTTGVIYKVDGNVATTGFHPAAGTVTITAEAAPGYILNGQSTWQFTFTNEACPPEPCVPTMVSALTLAQLTTTNDNCQPGMGGGGAPETPKAPETPAVVTELPQTGADTGSTFAKLFTLIVAGVTTYGAMFFLVNRRDLSKK